MYVDIKDGEMGEGDGQCELDRVAAVDMLKEKEKGVMAMGT